MSARDLDLQGVEHFNSAPEDVFRTVTDIARMPSLIPDLQSHEIIDECRLKCVVRPGFSFFRGKLNLTIQIEEIDPPNSALLRIAGRGIGTQIDVESRFTISADGGGTQMEWSAQVTKLKGLVAAVSPALTSAAAGAVLRSSWALLRKELGEAE